MLATTTLVSGTTGFNETVEVFVNTTGDCNDAAVYVGTVVADGAGNGSLIVALTSGDYVLATTTDSSNNTSEFSTCTLIVTNYFWVSNAGDWSDSGGTHWATTSGGGSFHPAPPTSTDYVTFDSNSFSGQYQLLEMDIDVYAKNIDFQDINLTPVFFSTCVLIIGV